LGGLSRPEVPLGAQRDLVDALHALHHEAGWPSLRGLAREAGCSHTTVSTVFSSPRLPSWGVLELVVEAMGGNVEEFHRLWLAASSPAERSTATAPRIAGRRAELTALRRHLDTGTGLLLVTGEAGVGKTRLVDTAAGFAGGTFVARGACLPLSTQVTLLPVTDVLRSIYVVDQGQWIKEALGECPPYVPAPLRRLLPELDQPADAAPALDDDWWRQRLFSAVGTILGTLTTLRPLAVLVEDLHWADSTTLDLLEHLLTAGTGLPLVGTWRQDDPTVPVPVLDWLVRVRRLSGVDELVLRPLTRDGTAEQLALLTGEDPDPASVDRIYRRTAGQPLFTEQLVAQAGDDQPLPDVLADLLDRRLDGLEDPAWRLARALGVADRPLADALLREVTALASAELTTGLHQLADRRLLRSTESRNVELRHPLLAEAIRRRLVGQESADEHRRIATALARSDSASAAEVAEHWQRAEDPGEEIGWRIRAARAAGARFAMAQEAEQWRRALDLWPKDAEYAGSPGVRKCDAYLNAFDALAHVHVTAASDLAREALGALTDLPDRESAALYQRAGYVRSILGDPEGGLVLLEKAIGIHERLPQSSEYVDALDRLEVQQRMMGQYAAAAATNARAIEISGRLGDARRQRSMLGAQAWHAAVVGDVDLTRAHIEAALGFDVLGPDPDGDVQLAAFHTTVMLMGGASADEVEAAGRRGLDAAAAWGWESFQVAWVRANISLALTRAGQVDRATEIIDPVTEGAPARDQWPAHRQRVDLDVVRGKLEAASGRLEALLALAVPWGAQRIELTESAAVADLWAGRPRAAVDRLLGVLRYVVTTDVSAHAGGAMVLAARGAADVVDSSSATPATRRELLGVLHGLHAESRRDPFAPLPTMAAHHALGASWAAELSRLAGQQSVETWLIAASAWDKLARPHDAAYCRWRGAQVALSTGQGTVAMRLLSRATREAREHVPLSAAITETAGQARPTLQSG
jgi:tetratricopeptide (TPR) repeat protein